MPAMERLYDEFKDEEFQMLAVAVGDEPEDVRNFQKRLGLTFPILLDQLGKAVISTAVTEDLIKNSLEVFE